MVDDSHATVQQGFSSEEKLQRKMAQLGAQQKEQEAQMLGYSSALPYVSLVGVPISAGALAIIPEGDARTFGAVCFLETLGEKKIGVVDPYNEETKKFLQQLQ